MVTNGCQCTYRYGGVGVRPQAFPTWMAEVLEAYMPYCGINDPTHSPDSCNVNLYENGAQSVGWRSDDEALFQGVQRDIRIVSLSLGQSRRFCLKRNWPEGGEACAEAAPRQRVLVHFGRHGSEALRAPSPQAARRRWPPNQPHVALDLAAPEGAPTVQPH